MPIGRRSCVSRSLRSRSRYSRSAWSAGTRVIFEFECRVGFGMVVLLDLREGFGALALVPDPDDRSENEGAG